METERTKRPVIIVGCTRSGTKLVSRIIGGHPDNFLITEHREKFHIKEDQSGIAEEQVWWNNFAFDYWSNKGKPLVRTPKYDEQDIAVVRDLFLSAAGDKRLIIKNPQNILRVRFIKKMFPDALFIFCVRNPWHGLQSRVIGGKAKYLIPSEKNYELPDDLLLKSIYSWKESIDIYNREKDENWHVVRYEGIVFNTRDAIVKLFDFLGMETGNDYFERVCGIPRDLEHRYYPVKKAFKESRFQNEITESVASGCRTFPYDAAIDSVPGGAFHYYVFEKKIIDLEQERARAVKGAKSVIKSLVRALLYITGGRRKLSVGPLAFGALSEVASACITQDDERLRVVAANGKKGEAVSFNILQMQYQRLRHYQKVIVMDSKGVPWLLLKNIDFSPAKRYDYTLTGEVEYIRKK